MKKITLQAHLKNHSQEATAQLMGKTQGAISHMLKSGRDIFLMFDDEDNLIYWEDIKRWNTPKAVGE
jgi:predicted transcriptional regulator